MLNVNVMGFLHNEETKMSTVRATSRVQEIRNRTDAIQQKMPKKRRVQQMPDKAVPVQSKAPQRHQTQTQ